MGGNTDTLEAKTMQELEQKAREWLAKAASHGMQDIRAGWDPQRVKKTSKGLSITMSAHT